MTYRLRRSIVAAGLTYIVLAALLFLGRHSIGRDFDLLQWAMLTGPFAALVGFLTFRERDKF